MHVSRQYRMHLEQYWQQLQHAKGDGVDREIAVVRDMRAIWHLMDVIFVSTALGDQLSEAFATWVNVCHAGARGRGVRPAVSRQRADAWSLAESPAWPCACRHHGRRHEPQRAPDDLPTVRGKRCEHACGGRGICLTRRGASSSLHGLDSRLVRGDVAMAERALQQLDDGSLGAAAASIRVRPMATACL